jgi:hypothetical protein
MFEQLTLNKSKITTVSSSNSRYPIWDLNHALNKALHRKLDAYPCVSRTAVTSSVARSPLLAVSNTGPQKFPTATTMTPSRRRRKGSRSRSRRWCPVRYRRALQATIPPAPRSVRCGIRLLPIRPLLSLRPGSYSYPSPAIAADLAFPHPRAKVRFPGLMRR